MNKYVAKIKVNGISLHLGYFDTAIDAATAYDSASSEWFCEFAHKNF